MGLGSEAGVFASAGSAAIGGSLRYGSSTGFSVLGGLSFMQEDYPDSKLKHAGMGALALQYLHNGGGWWHPFVETGGWYVLDAALDITRTYLNGAGTATGAGNTMGDLSYIFVRAGLLLEQSRADQMALSLEYGRERLSVNGYAERMSPQNPFEAYVATSTDELDLVKLRLQWSHRFNSLLDSTLWVAGVHGFDASSGLTAFVPGFGTVTFAEPEHANWVEYGARIGYQVTQAVTIDAFANGVSGHGSIETRAHAGLGLRFRF